MASFIPIHQLTVTAGQVTNIYYFRTSQTYETTEWQSITGIKPANVNIRDNPLYSVAELIRVRLLRRLNLLVSTNKTDPAASFRLSCLVRGNLTDDTLKTFIGTDKKIKLFRTKKDATTGKAIGFVEVDVISAIGKRDAIVS